METNPLSIGWHTTLPEGQREKADDLTLSPAFWIEEREVRLPHAEISTVQVARIFQWNQGQTSLELIQDYGLPRISESYDLLHWNYQTVLADQQPSQATLWQHVHHFISALAPHQPLAKTTKMHLPAISGSLPTFPFMCEWEDRGYRHLFIDLSPTESGQMKILISLA